MIKSLIIPYRVDDIYIYTHITTKPTCFNHDIDSEIIFDNNYKCIIYCHEGICSTLRHGDSVSETREYLKEFNKLNRVAARELIDCIVEYTEDNDNNYMDSYIYYDALLEFSVNITNNYIYLYDKISSVININNKSTVKCDEFDDIVVKFWRDKNLNKDVNFIRKNDSSIKYDINYYNLLCDMAKCYINVKFKHKKNEWWDFINDDMILNVG